MCHIKSGYFQKHSKSDEGHYFDWVSVHGLFDVHKYHILLNFTLHFTFLLMLLPPQFTESPNKYGTCIGEELSTLSMPSLVGTPPPRKAVKIFSPIVSKFAQGEVAIPYNRKESSMLDMKNWV